MKRKIHYHILVEDCFKYLGPSSLNLQIFWLGDPWVALLSVGRMQAGETERGSSSSVEQEGTGHLPSYNLSLSQSLTKSTVRFCPVPQAASERKTQQVKKTAHSSQTPLSPREQKKGRGEKTTENATGLEIMVSVALKRVFFLWNKGVYSWLHVLAEYLWSALS